MPLYEYQCGACQERTEVLQRMGDSPMVECPACGGELRRLISAPAFQFKGSGWYVTDYPSKSSAPKESDGEGASSGTKSAETGTAASGGEAAKGGGGEAPKSKPSGTGKPAPGGD